MQIRLTRDYEKKNRVLLCRTKRATAHVADVRWGSNPDFLLEGRTSASAECRHWSGRAVGLSSCGSSCSDALCPGGSNIADCGHSKFLAAGWQSDSARRSVGAPRHLIVVFLSLRDLLNDGMELAAYQKITGLRRQSTSGNLASTTLADLLTLLFLADPGSAVRTSLRT